MKLGHVIKMCLSCYKLPILYSLVLRDDPDRLPLIFEISNHIRQMCHDPIRPTLRIWVI
jgi:hypothetical protein